MNPHFARQPATRIASSGARARFVSAPFCSSPVWQSLWVLLLGFLSLSMSCSSVQSSVEAIVTGEPPIDHTYAGRQHFPVTPREAVEYLIDVAPHEGWQVVSTGEEYSTQGIRGVFFRIEPIEPIGEKHAVSGVFDVEPSGSSVRVSEQNGLPESLVVPLITAIKQNVRDR